jgi:predicted small lipoprotein YifL
MKYPLTPIAILLLFSLTACEGKKSLDGHPMDKPPPSADAPRDSEPNFDDLDDPTPDKPNKW